jgi:hypothetical protein
MTHRLKPNEVSALVGWIRSGAGVHEIAGLLPFYIPVEEIRMFIGVWGIKSPA